VISIPSPDQLDSMTIFQNRFLYGSCLKDIMDSDGCGFEKASTLMPARYPAVVAALNKKGQAIANTVFPPAVSDQDRARIAANTNTAENCVACGLDQNPYYTDLGLYQAVSKAAGSLQNPDYVTAFQAAVDYTAQKNKLSPADAEKRVRGIHFNLALKSDTAKVNKQLQSALPTLGGEFSDKTGYSDVHPPDFKTASNLNETQTGLGCFQGRELDSSKPAVVNSWTTLANSGDEFSPQEISDARAARAVAAERSKTYGAPLSALVETSRGLIPAETIIGRS
jgi:hypothetical protein